MLKDVVKQRWTEVTGDEAIALVQGGKYREDKPTWIRRVDSIWVLVNDQWRAWRANFGNRGEA